MVAATLLRAGSDEAREEVYCAAGGPGLRVPARKGQALLWYNHLLEGGEGGGGGGETDGPAGAASGTLGRMDELSVHGGCRLLADVDGGAGGPVLTKVVSNHWIEASEDPLADVELYRANQRRAQSKRQADSNRG